MSFSCYVVRHADAGKRGAVGDDRRPLSDRGRVQASAIADELAGAGLTHLYSSPFARCVETFEPLAARLGMEVRACDGLAEGNGATAALALVDGADGPVAICSHGDVIGALIEALDARGVPRDDDRLAKGSTWVLRMGADGVLGAHYVPPPHVDVA